MQLTQSGRRRILALLGPVAKLVLRVCCALLKACSALCEAVGKRGVCRADGGVLHAFPARQAQPGLWQGSAQPLGLVPAPWRPQLGACTCGDIPYRCAALPRALPDEYGMRTGAKMIGDGASVGGQHRHLDLQPASAVLASEGAVPQHTEGGACARWRMDDRVQGVGLPAGAPPQQAGRAGGLHRLPKLPAGAPSLCVCPQHLVAG